MLHRARIIAASAVAAALVGAALIVSADAVDPPPYDRGVAECVTSSSEVSVTLNGYCLVEHDLGVAPAAVVATGMSPISGADIPASMLADQFTETTFRVRAINQLGDGIKGLPISFSWVAYAGDPVTPPTSPPTTPPTTPPAPTTDPPAAGGFPNAATTGPADGTVFHAEDRCVLGVAGEVIDGADFTCPSQVEVTADGVTVRNSKLPNGITNYASGSRNRLVVQNNIIGVPPCVGVSAYGIGASNYLAEGNEMYVSEGFRVSGQHAGDTITIRNNYLRSCNSTGDHADGIQADENLSPALIDHNTLDLRDPDGSTNWTAAIFWNNGSVGAPTITNNMLAGGGPTLKIGYFGGPAYVIHDNSWIGGSWEYGPNDTAACDHFDWAGNRVVAVTDTYQVAAVLDADPDAGGGQDALACAS